MPRENIIRRSFGGMSTGQNCTPTRITTLAATRNSMAQLFSACANEILAKSNTTAALRQPGRFRTTNSSHITLRRSGFIMCMARSAKIRLSRVAVEHSHIQQLSDDFALHGLKPFHTPLGVMLDEKSPQKSPCIRCNSCDGFPCHDRYPPSLVRSFKIRDT